MKHRGEVLKVGAIGLALFAFTIVALLPTAKAFASCAGLSGNYAVLLQGFAAPGLPTQPAAGLGAIQLNGATCTVTGELIYNVNGTVGVFPTLIDGIDGVSPGFSGTSAQLTGTYTVQNPNTGTISFSDNGACSGCSDSGTAFNFTINKMSGGSELLGTSASGGPVLTLIAEKQAVFSPTQFVGAFPFSCVGTGTGTGVGKSFGGPLSLSGTIVYPPATCYLPLFQKNCLGGSMVFNNNGTSVTDGLYVLSPQSPNATDATLSDEDVLGISSGIIPVTEMSSVFWGTANQYHWMIGMNGSGAGENGIPANVVTCTGGANPAGTVLISPTTTISLITSPTNPSKHMATKQVTITNNTARYLSYGGTSPLNGPPPVSVINDNCFQVFLDSQYYSQYWIRPYSSCSFTVVCTNSGGTSVTSEQLGVGLDQAATNLPSNFVNVNCTN